jgi:hypothetical protein
MAAVSTGKEMVGRKGEEKEGARGVMVGTFKVTAEGDDG